MKRAFGFLKWFLSAIFVFLILISFPTKENDSFFFSSFIIGVVGLLIVWVPAFFKKKDQKTSAAVTSTDLFYDIPVRAESASSDNADLKKEDFRVAGIQYYEKNIHKLAQVNPDWRKTPDQIIADGKCGQKIPEFTYKKKPVYLIPEPTNKHDKNAIMVQIAGEHVGYIYSSDTDLVKKLLNKDVKYISSYFKGGHYKVVSSNGEEIEAENQISISVRIAYV